MAKRKGGGKPPKGRAAAKQKAQRGSNGRSPSLASTFMQSPRSSRHMADDDDDYDDDDDGRPQFRGFQQTSSPHGNPRFAQSITPGSKLRHQAISFVSAASSTTITAETQTLVTPLEHLAVSSPAGAVGSEVDEEEEEEEEDEVATMAASILRPRSPPAAALSFVVDLEGDPALVDKRDLTSRPRKRRSPSPAGSNSSDEVITFAGRSKVLVVSDPIPTPSKRNVSGKAVSAAARSVSDRGDHTKENTAPVTTTALSPGLNGAGAAPQPPKESVKTEPSTEKYVYQAPAQASYFKGLPPLAEPTPLEERPLAQGWGAIPPAGDAEYNPDAIWAPAPLNQKWRRGKLRPDLGPSQAEIDEYNSSPPKENKVKSAEMAEDAGEQQGKDSLAALRAEVKALHPKGRSPAAKARRNGRRQPKLRPLDSDDEDDDAAGEAAYDDYMANIIAQLEEEERESGGNAKSTSSFEQSIKFSGPSLMVEGEVIGEDELLKKHESSFADDMDGSDDDSSIGDPTAEDVDDLSWESEDEDDEEYDSDEQYEDDADLRERKREAMTDEKIARIFAKQEELGIHGDEMILDDGDWADDSGDQSGVGDVAAARAGIGNFTFGFTTPGRTPRRGKRSPSHFPSASAMADTLDQYGDHGFDIMDFDRPSLRNTKKGRKGGLPAELDALSDEDLKSNMAQAWENDRSKKRLKKAEREELRAQGMLGSLAKKGKTDLKQKYQFGISTTQIHAELREFLQNDGQSSMPFPPMDKRDRKDLHEIGLVLGLNSKSVGSGKNRFPVLYKTRTTPEYDRILFERVSKLSIEGRLTTKYGKSTARRNKANNMGSARGGQGGGVAAATIRNGEIVGAGAAEIGKDSFGHKMMEKMGWSKGMALGKDGEGRLVPVEQVMRVGTAGLGERR